MNLFQEIVPPSQIEPKLLDLWKTLAKENKTRASLFNLIVFNHESVRTDYIRSTVQKVVSEFPCRILFISFDPSSSQSYLKTAISVVFPPGKDNSIACDQIDIGIAGKDHLESVPSLILAHLMPDLPIYLLWTEDPVVSHPLFDPLTKLATRVIFDSESTEDLYSFAHLVLDLKYKRSIDVADLNWARTQGWRDLISSLFDRKEKRELLSKISLVKLLYNEKATPSFCHLKIQSLYLLSWLTSCLKWKFQTVSPALHFQFEKTDARIESTLWEKLGPGTVIGIDLHTEDGYLLEASRIPTSYHQVKVSISSPKRCELPYLYLLGKTATGQSLVKEICTKGSSTHFLSMLKTLTILDKDRRI